MKNKSSMKLGEDAKSDKKDASLGRTLLRMLGYGIVAGALLIGSTKELGDNVLNEDNINIDNKN